MVLNILEAYKNWTTSTYGRYRAGDRSNIRGSVEVIFNEIHSTFNDTFNRFYLSKMETV